MGTASPKHITNLLSPGPGLLGTIINQIQLLKQLSQALKARLPAPLDGHCQVAAVRQTTVVVHADSPAWATRLRYLAPNLAASLREDARYAWVREIKVKVRPGAEPSTGPSAAPKDATRTTVQETGPASLQQALQDVLARRRPTR